MTGCKIIVGSGMAISRLEINEKKWIVSVKMGISGRTWSVCERRAVFIFKSSACPFRVNDGHTALILRTTAIIIEAAVYKTGSYIN